MDVRIENLTGSGTFPQQIFDVLKYFNRTEKHVALLKKLSQDANVAPSLQRLSRVLLDEVTVRPRA